MTNNYILGGGIAGLIYAFYNKSYKVISPEFGGQMASHFPLGPRYLHHNEFSEKFLKDLNLPIKVITIRTGYQTYIGKYVDFMMNRDFKQRYFMKSRGQDNLEGYDDTVMSGNKSTFRALEVDFNKIIELLVEKLTKENRLITGKVISINAKDNRILLEDKQVLNYNKLVNTMPLNIFSKSVFCPEGFEFPSSESFRCMPMTYVWLKPKKLADFNYVYVAAKSIKHHRLTYDEKGLIADWFGAHNEEECKKVYKDEYLGSQILWNAQIIPFKGELKLKDVKFIGRYGTWDRHWKTEKVIEEAMKDGAE